uniref:Uncharacterized protein n=1 Tax=viral metagenome TaxID=1070528 RepID=A0A6C0K0A9_9ZZZZ
MFFSFQQKKKKFFWGMSVHQIKPANHSSELNAKQVATFFFQNGFSKKKNR